MSRTLRSWWQDVFVPRRRRPIRRLRLERLEDRTLLSGTFATLPLPLTSFGTAQHAGFLASANEVDQYQLMLAANDRVSISVSAQSAGSGLQSVLRVFDPSGRQVALDDQQGGDPQLTFEASTRGDYLVGVSATGDDAYVPNVAGSMQGGRTTGFYALDIKRTPEITPLADVTGSSFRLTSGTTAIYDGTVSGTFTVENRGAAASTGFTVQLVLSRGTRFDGFDPSAPLPATFTTTPPLTLGAGQSFEDQFTATMPNAPPNGFLASGPVYVGLLITPLAPLADSGQSDKSGVHLGEDFASLTIVTPVAANGMNQAPPAQVLADLNSQVSGSLAPTEVNFYQLNVTDSGRLTANVGPSGGSSLAPRLTLIQPDGQPLVQSDDGLIVQYLQPGEYFLSVGARTGTGNYQLVTAFVEATSAVMPLPTGISPDPVVAEDVNGDGILDLITANHYSTPLSVLLGIGDGCFQPAQMIAAGSPRVGTVLAADVNGDGKVDLVVTNPYNETVSVLLGNGDGTFQNPIASAVGKYPASVAIGDFNGDGFLDLAVTNYGNYSSRGYGLADTVSVLLGKGAGTFQPQQTFAVGYGPKAVTVADLNGDGKPDIAVANYGSQKTPGSTVSVLLNTTTSGAGVPSFADQLTETVGSGPRSLAVADLYGDGKLDLVVANYLSGTVSVLRGNGDGTFQAQQTFAGGTNPQSVVVADVNGDGKLDALVTNEFANTVSVLLGNGAGSLQPPSTFAAGPYPFSVAVADVNGDGIPDLVATNFKDAQLSVLLGNGDGTFQTQQGTNATGGRPVSEAVADINGDGKPDVIEANFDDNTVGVLLGNGDGTFQNQLSFAVGQRPDAVAATDVNNDGKVDLIVANFDVKTISVLLGNGDGTFQPQQTYPVGVNPSFVAVADVNGDGKPDLIVADQYGYNVSVLLGNGDGTFQAQKLFPAGYGPTSLALADINGDHKLDLIVADQGTIAHPSTSISVLLGKGDGTFQSRTTESVGVAPSSVVVADVNGDGKPDVIVANYGAKYAPYSTVSVLLGKGDGTFQPQQIFDVGEHPVALVAADVNGDGKPDLMVSLSGQNEVGLLLGNGNGTFQNQHVYYVGSHPFSLAVADINGDGKPDLVVANSGGNSLSVLLGNRNLDFFEQFYAVGDSVRAQALADVNRDKNLDLVLANYSDNTVGVLLGDGNNSFQTEQTFPVGAGPVAVAVADVNGDSNMDLIVADQLDNTVSVLDGLGAGTFQPRRSFNVGSKPSSVAVADGNGVPPEIVVANAGDNTVTILESDGLGGFISLQTLAVGTDPSAVAVVAGNGTSEPELVVANAGANTLSVLLGDGKGAFHVVRTLAVGAGPSALAVADVNGDGNPDIVVTNYRDNTVSVLLGDGKGGFLNQKTFATGTGPNSVAIGDVNGDGKPDIIVANKGDHNVGVLLGAGTGAFEMQQPFGGYYAASTVAVGDINGDGKPDITESNAPYGFVIELTNNQTLFSSSTPSSGVGLQNTPFRADLNGDGTPDTVILDRSGAILFRKGLPGGNDPFAPPVTVNSGRPARSLTVVQTASGEAVAAVDAGFDATLSAPPFFFVHTVSLYRLAADGSVSRSTLFSTPLLPTSITAGDLTDPVGTHNGLDDLVIADSLDDSVQIAFQQSNGTFSSPLTLPVGQAPSDISLKDVNGDNLLDIVITDQSSGDVTVLLNDRTHSFATIENFRAGTGLYDFDAHTATPIITTQEESVSLAAGDFTGDGLNDLVVVNRGTHSFSVLTNDGSSGFHNPTPALTFSTSDGPAVNDLPGPIVAGYFHGLGQSLDLAILMEDTAQVWIYTGDGHGHFTHTATIPAGTLPTGLTVVPGSSSNVLDLLVGNQFGDVLRLTGDGQGHFTPQQTLTGNRAPLDVKDLRGDKQPDALVADQSANRVAVQPLAANGVQVAPATPLTATNPATQLAPGAVQWAQLESPSGLFDAVVLASGSNSVLVYHSTGFDAQGDPTFTAPVAFPVGTDPVAVTVADVNGDNIPDMLVANQGSNDVSVLFGSIVNGQWVGTAGPRLKSGGSGPVATKLLPVNGSAFPDLVIFNSDGTYSVLPGRGQGFFDDRAGSVQNFSIPDGTGLGTPSFPPNSNIGMATTGNGSIVAINLGNFTASVVFAGVDTEVNALDAVSNDELLAAFSNGTVAELIADSTGQFDVAGVFEPLTGDLTDPSDIQAFNSEAGLLAFATDAGSSELFVFGLFPALEPPPATPPIIVTPGQDTSLTLIVTILFGSTTPSTATTSTSSAADTSNSSVENMNRDTVRGTDTLTSGAGDTTDDDNKSAAGIVGGAIIIDEMPPSTVPDTPKSDPDPDKTSVRRIETHVPIPTVVGGQDTHETLTVTIRGEMVEQQPQETLTIPDRPAAESITATSEPTPSQEPAKQDVLEVRDIDLTNRTASLPLLVAPAEPSGATIDWRNLPATNPQITKNDAVPVSSHGDWDLERTLMASLTFVGVFTWRQSADLEEQSKTRNVPESVRS